MKGLRKLVLLLSFPVLLASVSGCIVVPNFAPIKGPQAIRKVEVGKSSREDVRRILGRPQIVETREFYVYAWERPSAFVMAGFGYAVGSAPLGLKATRAIVEFDVEGNVTRLESSWDETEPKLPVLSCRREIPGCAKRRWMQGIGVTALEFTPDGERLAVATHLAQCGSCILDPSDGQLLTRLDFTTAWTGAHQAPPSYAFAAMSFSEDGHLLAAVDGSRLVIWEASDGTERMSMCPTGSKSCRVSGESVALSPDGARVAFRQRGKGLVVRGLEGGETVAESDASGPVFSPDGSRIAAQIGNGGVAILDSSSGTILASRPSESKSKWRLRALAISPDGRYLAVSSCAHVEIHRLDRILDSGRFDKPDTVALLPMPKTSGRPCWPQAFFSRDGSQLAVLTADALTRFEVPSGRLHSGVRLPVAPHVVAAEPGLEHLALASANKLRVCDLREEAAAAPVSP